MHVLYYFVLLTTALAGYECASMWTKYVKDPTFADQMCPTDQVEFQTVARTAISCVRRCAGAPGCESTVYLHGNMTCFGIKSDNPFSVTSSLPGAVFYKAVTAAPTATTTTTIVPDTPMVMGVAANQLTASSFWTDYGFYVPISAKLNNTQYCWCVANGQTNAFQWIQVDFLHLIQASAVITKGDPGANEWTRSYNIQTSPDCVTYDVITDDQGTDIIFPGNVDNDNEAINALVPPVDCRCFRIHPLTWRTNVALRFEVLGHVV